MSARVIFTAEQVVVRSKDPNDKSIKGGFIRLDRGVVRIISLQDEEVITFYNRKGEKLDIQIQVSNIASYTRRLIYNQDRTVVKGMTTFFLLKPLEKRNAGMESYSLLMDVADHGRLHASLGQN